MHQCLPCTVVYLHPSQVIVGLLLPSPISVPLLRGVTSVARFLGLGQGGVVVVLEGCDVC